MASESVIPPYAGFFIPVGKPKRRWRRSYADAMVGVPRNALNTFVCFSILMEFPKANPTAQELMDRFEMTRATAYRYRAALLAVRGDA